MENDRNSIQLDSNLIKCAVIGAVGAESAKLSGGEVGHTFMRLFLRRKSGAFLWPASIPFFVAIISIRDES